MNHFRLINTKLNKWEDLPEKQWSEDLAVELIVIWIGRFIRKYLVYLLNTVKICWFYTHSNILQKAKNQVSNA